METIETLNARVSRHGMRVYIDPHEIKPVQVEDRLMVASFKTVEDAANYVEKLLQAKANKC